YGLLVLARPVIAWNVVGVVINFLSVGAYFRFARSERRDAVDSAGGLAPCWGRRGSGLPLFRPGRNSPSKRRHSREGASMTAEHRRLEEARDREVPWRKWGPYLSERQWGTVREDYSESGDAWNYFTHDQARSRAYRWGEDGLAGISDDHQY